MEEKKRHKVQPGSRVPGLKQNQIRDPSKFSELRRGWVKTEFGTIFLIEGKEDYRSEYGRDVIIHIPRPGKIPDVHINLTSFTTEELNALIEFFTKCFDMARPIVERRDQEAQDAWEAGDDSLVRHYRAVPQLVFRQRPVREHSEGVQQRPSGVSESSGGGDSDRRVRRTGDELAESDEGTGGAQDDGTPTD